MDSTVKFINNIIVFTLLFLPLSLNYSHSHYIYYLLKKDPAPWNYFVGWLVGWLVSYLICGVLSRRQTTVYKKM